MELIVISDNKLKIMLSAPDMERYELETEGMDCTDAHTREVFRHIFSDARERIGFDTEGARLFVQLYTSKEGGCEIFVTKLNLSEGVLPFITPDGQDQREHATEDLGMMSDGERALLREVYSECAEGDDGMVTQERSPREIGGREIALIPATMEDLLALCRRLRRGGYRQKSSVYITDEDRAYLLLQMPCTSLYRVPQEYAFLLEYGEMIQSDRLSLYLSEHARPLCEANAVEVLGEL